MPAERALRRGIYARVSTADQRCEGQLEAFRRYADARAWHATEYTEYIDHGVSGAKERRPALEALLSAARRRDLAVVMVTKLDRLAGSLHHLLTLGRELEALGVELVVLDQAIDTSEHTIVRGAVMLPYCSNHFPNSRGISWSRIALTAGSPRYLRATLPATAG